MSKSFRVAALPIILSALLGGCAAGGGGAGDQGSVVGEGPLPATPTVTMQGISLSGSGTGSAFNIGGANDTASTATLTYGADGNLWGMSFSTPQTSLSFGPDEISESFAPDDGPRTALVGSNATSVAIVVDPAFHGWDYQSFGVWLKDVHTTAFQAGAISFGEVSPVSALPMSSGEFTGHAGGFYFDADGNRFATDAQMRAIADFQDRNIRFSTSQTLVNGAEKPGLNLSGTLSYAEGGLNHFSGQVQTNNGELTGDASGRFYGPNAEEIGGVYGLTGAGSKRMLGGFGGKR